MISEEDRIHLAVHFGIVARKDHHLIEKIEALIQEFYDASIATLHPSAIPLPALEMQTATPEERDVWLPVWTRAHEMTCVAARGEGVLGKINIHLAGSQYWEEAATRVRQALQPSSRPVGAPVLHLIPGGRA